jgi:hypothetical protein
MKISGILKKINAYFNLFRSHKTYSFNQIIHQYCGYPKWMSLPGIQHGWFLSAKPWQRDLDKKHLSLYLAWSKRIHDEWVKHSQVPVFILGAPFIHYRRLNNIMKSPDASGTIVFPAHSTPNNISVYDIDAYCNRLLELPVKYKPITICLHYYDMITSTKDKYLSNGFKVTSAGNPKSSAFVKHFYELLSTHKYATSNRIGSYVLYAIEIGIPFFLYGDEISVNVIRKKKDKNQKEIKESIKPLAENLFKKSMKDLSRREDIKINDDQLKFVLEESGIDDCLNPKDLKRVLLKYYYLKTVPKAIYKLLILPLIITKKLIKN